MMNPSPVMITLGAFAFLAVGCSARPTKPRSDAASGQVFSRPAAETQKAARDALVVLGFDVEKSDALYVEGVRPRKVGVFVGSGGETAGIWLEPVAADQTRVTVSTAKSLVGIAGQQNWDAEILAEMRKALP